MRALVTLTRLYRERQPSLVHHFHAKPILIGGIASLGFPDAIVINTVTGLGYAFDQGGLVRLVSTLGYRCLLRRRGCTIFQNPDDRTLFVERGWIPKKKAHLIVSSGVDTSRFKPAPEPSVRSRPVVLMIARLIRQKGIREYIEAAQIVHAEHPEVRFQLAGEWDREHPDAVDREWLLSTARRGDVDFLGYIQDVAEQMRQSDLFVLPSYYREGVPRVLLEAASCGLPLVTTDVPGCRETVVEGQTGYLVPPRDPRALATAINRLVENPELRRRLGRAGYARVRTGFGIDAITDQTLAVYQTCGIPTMTGNASPEERA
jgi:glycosyltransferase involved in cell wall biosynthesis